jgi:hypothetical protein
VLVDETGTNASLFSFFVAQDRLKKAQSESPEPIRNIEMPSATISKPIEAKSSSVSSWSARRLVFRRYSPTLLQAPAPLDRHDYPWLKNAIPAAANTTNATSKTTANGMRITSAAAPVVVLCISLIPTIDR